MATITLHKFGVVPEEAEHQVFTFILDYPSKLADVKLLESTEVQYGGHRWSIVCMRKEERYVGIFLKWRYTDGQSASSVTCKAKYTLTLIHRNDYLQNRIFHSTQKFSTSHALLGKSKFVAFDSLLDIGSGYLDETGRRIVLELSLLRCATRFEKTVDTSPSARTRKNASGYYFDTYQFLLANHKWYLRVYPEKLNSQGLPAVYLYLAAKALGISMEAQFTLNIGEDATEILAYNFGEGAKFDGFGKTLPEPLYNVKKLNSLTVGVEISCLMIYKISAIHLRPQNVYAPQMYKDYSSQSSSLRSGSSSSYRTQQGTSLTAAEAFQDQDGNFWKMELDRAANKVTVKFDKGVHHYPHNKTRLLCWTGTLLSREPGKSRDVEMESEPLVGYFSNFIDDKGYMMTFSLDSKTLDDPGCPYVADGELLLRINFLSLQTIPLGMRSIPRFDYQIKHLIRARQELHDNLKSLEDMREMSASRASLSGSGLDLSAVGRDDRLQSESSTSSGPHSKLGPMYKSYDSLDALSTGDMLNGELDDNGKTFYRDFLRHIAEAAMETHVTNNNNTSASDDAWIVTRRDHGDREDVSTESGVTVSDESSLLNEARPSVVDLARQKELVGILTKFLQQRLPIRVTEVVELGSLGTGTSTRSRMDVDLILFSPDLPREGHRAWMPALLEAAGGFMQTASHATDPFYPLPPCTDVHCSPLALQFSCSGLDVDVMLCHDWDSDEASGGYIGLYDVSCRQTAARSRQWCGLASCRLQRKFLVDQPAEVKEVIKVVKHWRNGVQWRRPSARPGSYLLSLLIIRAVEDAQSYEIKRVLDKLGAYVLAPELSLAWSRYYVPDKYPVDWDPPSPVVRDPANPGVNVAESLPYWGQFRAEMQLWMKGLGLQTTGLV